MNEYEHAIMMRHILKFGSAYNAPMEATWDCIRDIKLECEREKELRQKPKIKWQTNYKQAREL